MGIWCAHRPARLARLTLWFLAWTLLLLAVPQSGRAQATASIVGTITDQTGASIKDAKVTVKSIETGAVRETTTDELGYYRILSLPVGRQELKAEKGGFRPALRNQIDLVVGQEAVLNLSLQVATSSVNIEVKEESPVINTSPAAISGIVGERQIKDLPLNGRSFDTLITLNPGTINYSALKSPNTSTSVGNTFSVAGRRTSENIFLFNGIEYTGSSQLAITPGGVSGELLGVDAIREFNVLTDTYSAEYGKRAGAQVSAVTQSGTNTLHGSAYEFLRNSALDSAGPFDSGVVSPLKRNQFGVSAGGPLINNKLFLFGNYEGFRQSYNGTSVSVVPDNNTRAGELPNACTGVVAPLTGATALMEQYASLFWPAPNGPELMVPSSGTCTNPPATVPSGTAKAFYNPNDYRREDFGTVRADYMAGKNDTATAAYTVDDGSSTVPMSDPLFASGTDLRMQVLSLSETHVFSPQVLNTATVGFSRASFGLSSVVLANIPENLSFVSGLGPGGIIIGGGATTTANGSITSAGPNNAAGVSNHRNLFTYEDTLRVSRGIHQFSIGMWLQQVQDNEDSASRTLGQATFTNLSAFLKGFANNFQVVPEHTPLSWRSLFGAWYAEDSIRLKRNLTLVAGLRDEFTTGWTEAYGKASNYFLDPQGVLYTNPSLGSSVFSHNNAKGLFSPRVGLAWDVFGDGSTAVRSGYGIYYSLIDDLAFLLNSLPPYNGAASYSGALTSFTPVTQGPPPANTIYAPQGIQQDAKTPMVQEWNLSIERRLSRDTSVSIAYVGSFGIHELLSMDMNSIAAEICGLSAGCPTTTTTPIQTVPEGTRYIPLGSRPNPALSAGFFWMTAGNSSYNALQVDVTRKMASGLEFRGNYTWSKGLDINSGLTGAQANNQAQMVLDRTNLHFDWGPSALNAAHQASLSAEYELPFGRGRRWLNDTGAVERGFVSGWQVNGIATFLSGFPFTPLAGSNRSGDGDIRNPDRVSFNPNFSGTILTGNPDRWYNPAAFVLPAVRTFGDVPRGTLTGPGLADFDMSIFKNTRVSEKTTLQFRAEFFNILNRTNYGPPNANVFSGTAISPSAGLIQTTATLPREIQLGLKYIF